MCLSGSRHSSQARTACEYTTMSYLPPREKGRAQRRAVGSSENPEGGSTYLVGIICTLVVIGLTDAPKSGAPRTHGSDRPAADGRDTALTHSVCFSPLFSIKQEKFSSLFLLEVIHGFINTCPLVSSAFLIKVIEKLRLS